MSCALGGFHCALLCYIIFMSSHWLGKKNLSNHLTVHGSEFHHCCFPNPNFHLLLPLIYYYYPNPDMWFFLSRNVLSFSLRAGFIICRCESFFCSHGHKMCALWIKKGGLFVRYYFLVWGLDNNNNNNINQTICSEIKKIEWSFISFFCGIHKKNKNPSPSTAAKK